MKQVYITKITAVHQETSDISTISFHFPNPVTPGQCVMIWIPDVDEIPMSLSEINSNQKSITFRKIGEATTALHALRKSDTIGVRGPFGNGFTLTDKNLLFVGGGTGIGMLAPAVEQAIDQKRKVTIVIGAKTHHDLFFVQRLKKLGATVEIATDDGSQGHKGFASELAINLMQKKTFDAIYTCGPELMMKQLLDHAGDIPFQASLERYMKCAIGVCGQCCIGNGLRVCAEGPVFDGKTLKTVKDFGVYRRDAAGRKILF